MTGTTLGVVMQGCRSPQFPMIQNALLAQHQVDADLCVASRKKLFEVFAEMLSDGVSTQIDADKQDSDDQISAVVDDVFQTLNDREKLGSTGLGKGIALPHGRLRGLTEPRIAIARLQSPIAYDSPDGEPVWLAVCLIAPEEANDVHLQLLGALASKFSDENFINRAKSVTGDLELYELFQNS